ncbi:MAG: hypothetical protein KC925_03900 [Candidatus Doudnabacteria bacterium]|nr:hypothetical protein [Candidatus Doudnabacteria bacterium]
MSYVNSWALRALLALLLPTIVWAQDGDELENNGSVEPTQVRFLIFGGGEFAKAEDWNRYRTNLETAATDFRGTLEAMLTSRLPGKYSLGDVVPTDAERNRVTRGLDERQAGIREQELSERLSKVVHKYADLPRDCRTDVLKSWSPLRTAGCVGTSLLVMNRPFVALFIERNPAQNSRGWFVWTVRILAHDLEKGSMFGVPRIVTYEIEVFGDGGSTFGQAFARVLQEVLKAPSESHPLPLVPSYDRASMVYAERSGVIKIGADGDVDQLIDPEHPWLCLQDCGWTDAVGKNEVYVVKSSAGMARWRVYKAEPIRLEPKPEPPPAVSVSRVEPDEPVQDPAKGVAVVGDLARTRPDPADLLPVTPQGLASPPPPKRDDGLGVVFWTATGVAAAGLATAVYGGVAGLEAQQDQANVRGDCTATFRQCASRWDAADARISEANVWIVVGSTLALAGATVAVGDRLGWFDFGKSAKLKPEVDVRPSTAGGDPGQVANTGTDARIGLVFEGIF